MVKGCLIRVLMISILKGYKERKIIIKKNINSENN